MTLQELVQLLKPVKGRLCTKIELCSRCCGEGTLIIEELINYHKGEYSTKIEQCPHCGGTGRVKIVEFISKFKLDDSNNSVK